MSERLSPKTVKRVNCAGAGGGKGHCEDGKDAKLCGSHFANSCILSVLDSLVTSSMAAIADDRREPASPPFWLKRTDQVLTRPDKSHTNDNCKMLD